MDRLRTFGIVAHIDAGKTTLTERILFDSGAQAWVGSVDDGTATMDWMPAERARGISITAAATRVAWNGHTLQVVDTPGHVDFVAEVERCLRVIDGVVVVVDGVRGVESQTRAVWQQAVAAGLPRLVFVNKLDRSGADFGAAIAELAEEFECAAVPLIVPFRDEAGGFAGLGDTLGGAVQWFEGRPSADSVPALQAALEVAHDRVLEFVADRDDALLADVLAGQRIAVHRLQAVLRREFLAGRVVPVLGGSALYNRGVDWLLDAVAAFLPAVGELPRRPGGVVGPWSVDRAGDPGAPFGGLVFKVQHLDTVWNYVRVVRGRLEPGAALVRGGRAGAPQRIAEVWTMRAERHQAVPEAVPGEIVVLPGDFGFRTGDTICAAEAPLVLPTPRFPSPVLAVTFEPALAADAARIHAAVRELAIDDPTLRVARERDRIVVRGMGELHLEVVAELARARAGVEFRVSRPRVDCRETVGGSAEGSAEVRAIVVGRERVARCSLRVEPQPDGGPASVEVLGQGAAAVAAAEELRARVLSGLRVGPMVDLRVVVLEVLGEAGDEAMVQQAAAKAFDAALARAGWVELEPWLNLEIVAPAGSSAAVLADLGARGAEMTGVSSGRLGTRLTGRAPLSRMLGYVTRLRSISKGLGQVTMRPAGFLSRRGQGPVPSPPGPVA